MADIIQLLPDSVANQIAAGEVIQRPASVVKELVENAIDAGATLINVVVKNAGKTLVQIIDNGYGMSDTDARLSFERHATSKIRKAEDLFALRTMGFRGEALASIAAIAQVEVKTRKLENELGTRIVISGSEVELQEPVAMQPGTNFMVSNLFYNIPVRRKFLKANSTEFGHILTEMQRVALANPEIGFSLTHNDTLVYEMPDGNLKQRILSLFGKTLNKALTPISTETSVVKISGYITSPEQAKKSNYDQFFFVNGRYMRHPYFHKALMMAYEELLVPGMQPSYFVYFETDPTTIDVNIHPTKTEIKFEDANSIFQILRVVVKEALGKFNLAPSIDFNMEGAIEIPVLSKNTAINQPLVDINPDFNPFNQSDTYQAPREKLSHASYTKHNALDEWEKLYTGLQTDFSDKEQAKPEEFVQQTFASRLNKQETETGKKYLQVRSKFILTVVKSGIMLINQKGAHERILYEKFLSTLTQERIHSQQQMFPEVIELMPEDKEVLAEISDTLAELGFIIQFTSDKELEIRGIPAYIESAEATALFRSMLADYKDEVLTKENLHENSKEFIAHTLARASALQYGQTLSGEEMQALVDGLFACQMPHYSPSGKKIVVILTDEEIASFFQDI